MKKIYETPICQTICTAEDDILTLSTTLDYIEYGRGGSGDYSGGAVMNW